MSDKNNKKASKKEVISNLKSKISQLDETDEYMHLMIYGNLKITIKDTGEVLVNKRI